MVNPAPGGKLAGTTATFVWTDTGANEYWLTVGTMFGGYDIYSASLGLARQTTVTNLPTLGRTIYVRQWSRHGYLWSYKDYTYIVAY